MKNADKYRKLLTELSRDPRLKQAIGKARRQPPGNAGTKVETATRMCLMILAIASRFSRKKRARAIDEVADIVHLLVQISFLLKENIFDRTEVKRFFRQTSAQIYAFVQECVAMILPTRKHVMRSPRPRYK